ncbi:MAG TPA: class I SAM-dependent methyltransferase [Methylomirabilota bacterium]|nr:class I SAM-dependent methyltransferase [Methylomirabilota bacterium]
MKDDALLAEWLKEEQAPFVGWDFSHINDRTIEEKPPWSYAAMARSLMRAASSALDLGTGGGEILAELRDAYPTTMTATEAYPPNVEIADARLGPLGVTVVPYEASEATAPLPFPDASYDVIISRHEAYDAREVARVLAPRGHFLTQQVTGTSHAALLQEFGVVPQFPDVTADRLASDLRAANLVVDDVRDWRGWHFFKDVGALVYYLRAVPWDVPDFSVTRHRDVLLGLQRRLERDGQLGFQIGRFLIAAHKPA